LDPMIASYYREKKRRGMDKTMDSGSQLWKERVPRGERNQSGH